METEAQVKRLEQCFKVLDMKPKKLKSDAIRGLIDDAIWVMKNVEKGPALDANVIAAAQYVEHYEMAGYGTALAWARLMKHAEIEALLEETLKEEKMADETLNQLAEGDINLQVQTGM